MHTVITLNDSTFRILWFRIAAVFCFFCYNFIELEAKTGKTSDTSMDNKNQPLDSVFRKVELMRWAGKYNLAIEKLEINYGSNK